MKLSELILEEYQANEEKIFKTRDLFENEKQELVLTKLRYEYIKLLDEMPILAQAHKDALYMEEQVERANVKVKVEEEIEVEGKPRLHMITIYDADLSVRTSNALRLAKIATLGQIYDMGPAELSRYRNCGRKSIRELDELFISLGFNDWIAKGE